MSVRMIVSRITHVCPYNWYFFSYVRCEHILSMGKALVCVCAVCVFSFGGEKERLYPMNVQALCIVCVCSRFAIELDCYRWAIERRRTKARKTESTENRTESCRLFESTHHFLFFHSVGFGALLRLNVLFVQFVCCVRAVEWFALFIVSVVTCSKSRTPTPFHSIGIFSVCFVTINWKFSHIVNIRGFYLCNFFFGNNSNYLKVTILFREKVVENYRRTMQ